MGKKKYNWTILIFVCCLTILIIIFAVIDKKSPEDSSSRDPDKIFEECVIKTKPILYGRENSQVFNLQKEDLGKSFNLITFVDCSREREKCMGILLIPAWKINEQIYYGSFSKEVLTKIMGCE
jgi:hypothetical protein